VTTAGAAAGGIGSLVVGLVILFYQLGTWAGHGEYFSKVHFFAGLTIAALLFLGGGVLGAAGGATAAFGDGVGRFALESAVDVAASAGDRPVAATGGERVAVGGAIFGLVLLAFYIGFIKSGRPDLKAPLIRGGLVGIFLGAGAGLVGMAIGLIRTSGNTAGQVLVGVF
jgi:hypothetical protein